MPLKITRAVEPIIVDRITATIYSVPGIGKTALGYTAEDCILLDFDRKGTYPKNRKSTVLVNQWSDVANLTAADLAGYKTAVVDTAGRALDMVTLYVLEEDTRYGSGGAPSQKGWGRIKTVFVGWLHMLQSLGLDVVLLVHSTEDKSGDELIERLDVQGGSKNEVYKSSNLMGRLYLNRGKRILNFSPTDTSFGKNPAQLPPIEVPDFEKVPGFLGTLLAEVKSKLNEFTAEQAAAVAAQAEWKAKCDECKDADAFTALVEPAKALDVSVQANCKRILVKVAKEKGFELGKDGKFAAIVVPAAQGAT